MYALANLRGGSDGEGGYAVRHSRHPVSDFGRPKAGATAHEREALRLANPMMSAFPILFPYGQGAIEGERRVQVSFMQHVRWAIQYFDRRFCTHHSFPFVAFAVQQKREALGSVRVHMARCDFERDSVVLTSLTAKELKKAEDEERTGGFPTNPAVQVLRKHLRAVGGRVMGSDHARAAYRPQIWGTMIMKKPSSLWITVNPVDLHDPVLQVFAGEDIDMDEFLASAGPDKDTRARNVAKNPYAAAKFFRYIIVAMLETLFGVDASGHKVKSTKGILGEVEAYYGVVEAQGRGTLHLHMLIWLKNAPSSDDVNTLLEDGIFRQKLVAYIRENIRAHLDGFSEEGIKTIAREKELAYSRPPNPKSAAYKAERRERERAVVRSQQVHTCTPKTCLRLNKKTGKLDCKRHAPFPLHESDFANSDGTIGPRRTYGYLNSWNPTITECLCCNNDIKFLTSGRETRATIWYITCYATKKQSASHNMSALMADGLAYHEKMSDDLMNAQDRNRLMLFRCLQALNRDMEYSAPQVISHLMGWGDTFTSHSYVSIYWSSMVAKTLREFPELRSTRSVQMRRRRGCGKDGLLTRHINRIGQLITSLSRTNLPVRTRIALLTIM